MLMVGTSIFMDKWTLVALRVAPDNCCLRLLSNYPDTPHHLQSIARGPQKQHFTQLSNIFQSG